MSQIQKVKVTKRQLKNAWEKGFFLSKENSLIGAKSGTVNKRCHFDVEIEEGTNYLIIWGRTVDECFVKDVKSDHSTMDFSMNQELFSYEDLCDLELNKKLNFMK